MQPTVILIVASLFFAGILAGVEFAIHYGIRVPAMKLDDRSQLVLRQALVLRLRVLVPACFAPALLTGVAVTLDARSMPGFGVQCAGMVALLVWILIRIVGTVPINSATLTWSPDAPPLDWQGRVNRAERFHTIGVWAVIAAFACFLAATALNGAW